MLRAEALQAGAAFASEMQRIALPLQVAPAQDFGALYSQVQAEVHRFIQSGQDDAGTLSAWSMRAEARALRARMTEPVSAVSATAESIDVASATRRGEFLDRIAPWAREAAQSLGVAPEIVVAHAALESGWGQRPLRETGSGDDTHNYFGIKAGGGWMGGVAESLTTEFEDGAALKKTESFRSYPDDASAFRDYARLLLNNPGYRGALQTGADAQAFAAGLVRGGYATDPDYAAKFVRVARQLQASSRAQLAD
ncbi:glucosaminidase domain-containing protein [Ramlibacter sp. H39-3-26]|uniref:glycoside hydrolase family 73 protein n=1 Tax=Curvibacter soli TaxID=3031331 RepID=UPI0023DC9CE2|nr:glucosaminidase domain-containing protein [Ramlibacter sp. H39-3-26]MDF1484205.1 glucosaminidase domain-containing protein [Ramlibacter sp. H39-3-26]